MEIYKWVLLIFLILFLSLNFVSANEDINLSFDVNETYLDEVIKLMSKSLKKFQLIICVVL